ncbi:hypothetical protein [Mesorhizobium sp. B2-8-9]|uniref:hypothetical protein n=1 Tax=Mesorhizobium sp. B2-8-9 TaxID=2589899 RepID=UPI0011293B3F|nr:hypothetical protein [Mesorhizobium sp. B2-8-9]TPI85235.1 hypothetical protein FJ423_02575 [Mesorhizobium sp. B2-8-9]
MSHHIRDNLATGPKSETAIADTNKRFDRLVEAMAAKPPLNVQGAGTIAARGQASSGMLPQVLPELEHPKVGLHHFFETAT